MSWRSAYPSVDSYTEESITVRMSDYVDSQSIFRRGRLTPEPSSTLYNGCLCHVCRPGPGHGHCQCDGCIGFKQASPHEAHTEGRQLRPRRKKCTCHICKPEVEDRSYKHCRCKTCKDDIAVSKNTPKEKAPTPHRKPEKRRASDPLPVRETSSATVTNTTPEKKRTCKPREKGCKASYQNFNLTEKEEIRRLFARKKARGTSGSTKAGAKHTTGGITTPPSTSAESSPRGSHNFPRSEMPPSAPAHVAAQPTWILSQPQQYPIVREPPPPYQITPAALPQLTGTVGNTWMPMESMNSYRPLLSQMPNYMHIRANQTFNEPHPFARQFQTGRSSFHDGGYTQGYPALPTSNNGPYAAYRHQTTQPLMQNTSAVQVPGYPVQQNFIYGDFNNYGNFRTNIPIDPRLFTTSQGETQLGRVQEGLDYPVSQAEFDMSVIDPALR